MDRISSSPLVRLESSERRSRATPLISSWFRWMPTSGSPRLPQHQQTALRFSILTGKAFGTDVAKRSIIASSFSLCPE